MQFNGRYYGRMKRKRRGTKNDVYIFVFLNKLSGLPFTMQ